MSPDTPGPREPTGSDPASSDVDPSEEAPPSWPRRLLGLGRELLLLAAAFAVLLPVVGWLRAPDLPEAAPDFTLPLLDGGTRSLAELRGQVVVLNFWAAWCGPCRVEAPGLSRFAEANPDIPVLGIAVDGDRATLERARRDLGITYPVLRADPATQQAYGATTLPTTVVVGPEGEVWAANVGLVTRPQLWWMTRDLL